MATVKIDRRLYEHTAKDKTRSYFCDLVFDERGKDGKTARKQKRVKLNATNRTDARAEQAKLKTGKADGKVVIPTKKTLKDVADEFLSTHDVKPRTLDTYESHLRVNVLPWFGDACLVQSITPLRVTEWNTWLRQTRNLAPDSCAGAWATLSGVMSHAHFCGYVPANPVSAVPRAKRPQRANGDGKRVLTQERVERLLSRLNPVYLPITWTATRTGMRQSELLGFTWGQLDLLNASLCVNAQLSRGTTDNPARRVPVKTGDTRRVELSNETVAYLAALKDTAEKNGFARDNDYVFCTRSGRPLHYRNLGKAFTKAADDAGLNDNPEERRLHFHDLRRTYGSRLLQLGLPILTVAEMLGHTPQVLLEAYAKTIPDVEGVEAKRRALEGLFTAAA